MPNPWAMIDTSFPTFTGKESYREQVGALQDYLYLVVEELKYQLANLNAQNWNQTALKKMQSETVKPTNEELKALTEQVNGIANRLTQIGASLSDLAERTKKAEEELPKLWEGLELLAGDVDALNDIIVPDGFGGATIGKDGVSIRLMGDIYINGVLVEQEVQHGIT